MQTTQTTFQNLYMPMNFIKEDQLIASVFGPARTAQIPEFKIWKLDKEVTGDQTVATPPPHRKVPNENKVDCKKWMIAKTD